VAVTCILAAITTRATSSDEAVLIVCKCLLVLGLVCLSSFVLQVKWSNSWRLRWLCRIASIVGALIVLTWGWFKWGETPAIRASAHRRALLEEIREQYIQENNPVDKAVASGQLPPAIYMNQQLEKREERMRVTDTPPAQPTTIVAAIPPKVPLRPSGKGKHPLHLEVVPGIEAQPTSFVPIASDRGYLGVVHISMYAYPLESKATITVQNLTNQAVYENAIVRAAIIVSPLLADSEKETTLYSLRPEWQSGGGIIPREMPSGSIFLVTARGDFSSFDEYKELENGSKVIYVVTEIWARDHLGVLPATESCWYVQPPQWDKFHLCFGHNGFGDTNLANATKK